MSRSDLHQLVTRLDRAGERLKRGILSEAQPMQATVALCDGETTFADCGSLPFRPIALGEEWGERWRVAWFRFRGQVPSTWNGQCVVARLDLGGEGLVFDRAGNMLQGITNGSVFDSDFTRDIVRLGDRCQGGEEVALTVEATAAGLFGLFTVPDPGRDASDRYGRYTAKLNAAELCLFDTEAWGLWLDVEHIRSTIRALPEDDTARRRLIRFANEVIDRYDNGASTSDCRAFLESTPEMKSTLSHLTATAVGHAHIDTAWLWPVRESIRKCARTFATQLNLIERYPNYMFGASQAQHYAFVKEHYPKLYQRIKTAVAKGRWEVQGGMWVEADCNLTDGESLVRQIVHGKNFFRDEFGVDIDNLWLPDVFGYSAALPQMLQKSGIRYFLTQKLSWNQTNEFPHHTFVWEGIDGSEVVAHFPPENTYNSTLSPESITRGGAHFKERDRIGGFLSLFGVGDGGGGPKEEHIEAGLRQRTGSVGPSVQFGSAFEFFAQLERDRDKLPIWSGELYLELHRGTLTTQARTKKLNRKLELKLRAVEKLWSCLPLDVYPRDRLDQSWKTVLLNQFHDILPGSSITSVYRTTESELEAVDQTLTDLQRRAAERLWSPDPNACVFFNPTHYAFEGDVELPTGWGNDAARDGQSRQPRTRITIPSYGFATVRKPLPAQTQPVKQSDLVLQNRLVRYEFSTDGQLIGAYDKEVEREILIPGQSANLFTLYDDRPNDWDAWDIDLSYERCALENQRVVRPGAVWIDADSVRAIFSLGIGNSRINQEIILEPHSRQLRFTTRVEWREDHKMLRVSFPVAILADSATFDIQYGYAKRPTHRNTSWDQARFEVVGHRYADLSEPDYGVALLNDCKYGYKVHRSVLDLCLLRSPTYPDPDADRGHHEFTYSFLPHTGDLIRSNVIAEAALLNQPPIRFDGCHGDAAQMPIRLDGDGVSLEVVKRAEKEECLVLRIIETHGCRSAAVLYVDPPWRQLISTNLIEWTDGPARDIAGPVALTLDPFEIRTYKLKM